MTDDLVSLSDAVLPLIRSQSRELWRYRAATEQGMRMQEGAGLLELALEDPEALAAQGIAAPTPKELHQVTHKALASAIRVIARADDSAGIIGDSIRTLIDLHPRTAALAGVPPLKLADWIFSFHFDDDVDYFNLDPVAYAPALGEKGVARLRRHVEELREKVPPPDPADPISRYDHRAFLVQWFDERFAVLDRDVEAIIRTHLKDGKVAAWYEDVAEALEEIGEFDLAIDWAQQATLFGLGHQSRKAASRWERLVVEHRPGEVAQVVRTVFERWPGSGTGARLVAVSGPGVMLQVQAALQSRPEELARFQLEIMGDARLAWATAEERQVTDATVWWALADAYWKIDPVAAAAVQAELVAATVVEANTRKYRPAARELVKLRKRAAAAGPEALDVVDGAIAELRERYRRRPSFIAALDKARLP